MEIENLFRYPALAVGLKPSASPKPACAGCSGLFTQRPSAQRASSVISRNLYQFSDTLTPVWDCCVAPDACFLAERRPLPGSSHS
jgi:hypothetical protein